MPTMPTHSKRLDRLEAELAASPHPTSRHEKLLSFLAQTTGADLAGAYLTDDSGRVMGGVISTVLTERSAKIGDRPPTLSALLAASPLPEHVWKQKGHGVAFADPQGGVHAQSSPAYPEFRFSAWFVYPKSSDKRNVLVVLLSATKAFGSRELRILQSSCERFSKCFVDVTKSGVRFTHASVLADHRVFVDSEYRVRSISAYLHAMLSFFYGPLKGHEGQLHLPTALVSDLARIEREYMQSVIRTSVGIEYCFTRRKEGRVLCIVARSTPGKGHRLTCHEDLSRLEFKKRIRIECERLLRDSDTVFRACLAIIDRVGGYERVQKAAGLVALKPASCRRIINRAHAILRDLEAQPPSQSEHQVGPPAGNDGEPESGIQVSVV